MARSVSDLVAEVLRRERTSRGLSQAEMAARAGIDAETYAVLEDGSEAITLDHAEALCRALGVPLADLLASEDRERAREATSAMGLVLGRALTDEDLWMIAGELSPGQVDAIARLVEFARGERGLAGEATAGRAGGTETFPA